MTTSRTNSPITSVNLNSALATLFKAACAARDQAYAPYSNFKVGAALYDREGRIHKGCNVENAAYSQTLCAESTVIAAMIVAGGRLIDDIAIVSSQKQLCAPCGGCRQMIHEFSEKTTLIHLFNDDGSLHQVFTIEKLLPHFFGPKSLK